MAEIFEVIEDTFDGVKKSIKKIDKKKALLIGGIAAGGIGLVVWYRNKDNAATSTDTTLLAGSADTASDSSSSGDSGSGYSTDGNYTDLVDSFNDAYEQIKTDYDQKYTDLEQAYNDKLSTYDMNNQQQLDTLQESTASTITSLAEQLEEEKAKSYDSSVDYYSAVSSALKAGSAADSDTVSNLIINRAAKISDSNDLANYSTSYIAGVDYQAAINKAKASGASQSTIDILNSQRQTKIAATGATANNTSSVSSGASKSTVTKSASTSADRTSAAKAAVSKSASTIASRTSEQDVYNRATAASKGSNLTYDQVLAKTRGNVPGISG